MLLFTRTSDKTSKFVEATTYFIADVGPTFIINIFTSHSEILILICLMCSVRRLAYDKTLNGNSDCFYYCLPCALGLRVNRLFIIKFRDYLF